MFFKNVDFADYPLTDQGTFQACLDELKGSSYEKLSKESKKDFDLMFEEVVEPYSNYF